jgi:hypothetical protein
VPSGRALRGEAGGGEPSVETLESEVEDEPDPAGKSRAPEFPASPPVAAAASASAAAGEKLMFDEQEPKGREDLGELPGGLQLSEFIPDGVNERAGVWSVIQVSVRSESCKGAVRARGIGSLPRWRGGVGVVMRGISHRPWCERPGRGRAAGRLCRR